MSSAHSRSTKGPSAGSASGGFGVLVERPDEATAVITVRGELDLATAPRLKWPLVDALDAGCRRLVVDLAGVGFMDSTALGVLIGVRRSLRLGDRLAVVCTNPAVLKIFEISGLDLAFQIFPAIDDALAYVGHQDSPEG